MHNEHVCYLIYNAFWYCVFISVYPILCALEPMGGGGLLGILIMQDTQKAASGGEKEFYSLEEVAELLGVNYQLIYKLVRSGELPSARIGKVYRVMRGDLSAYVEQSKGHSGGGTCSVCGNRYHSRLALKHECSECGEPICVDCWIRKQTRHCPAHSGKSAKNSASPVAPGSEAVKN